MDVSEIGEDEHSVILYASILTVQLFMVQCEVTAQHHAARLRCCKTLLH